MLDQEPLEIEDYRMLKELDIEIFPLARDFEIDIPEATPGEERALCFRDQKLGVVIGFPWHDAEVLLAQWRRDGVPLGTTDAPYEDQDQGWRFIAWEANAWAALMAGNEDVFNIWVRVPLSEYKAKLVAAFNKS